MEEYRNVKQDDDCITTRVPRDKEGVHTWMARLNHENFTPRKVEFESLNVHDMYFKSVLDNTLSN